MSTHPINDLDELTHQRVRLGVLALLSKVGELEFTRIRDDLGTTDGNLSRHLTALSGAGLVTIRKTSRDTERSGARSWISLSPTGAQALRKEVAALRALFAHVPTEGTAGAPETA